MPNFFPQMFPVQDNPANVSPTESTTPAGPAPMTTPGIDLHGYINELHDTLNSLVPQTAGQPNLVTPSTGFFGTHPALAKAIDYGLIGAAGIQPSRTPGEAISNVARGVLGVPQTYHALQTARALEPLQMLAPIAELMKGAQTRQLQQAQIQDITAQAKERELFGQRSLAQAQEQAALAQKYLHSAQPQWMAMPGAKPFKDEQGNWFLPMHRTNELGQLETQNLPYGKGAIPQDVEIQGIKSKYSSAPRGTQARLADLYKAKLDPTTPKEDLPEIDLDIKAERMALADIPGIGAGARATATDAELKSYHEAVKGEVSNALSELKGFESANKGIAYIDPSKVTGPMKALVDQYQVLKQKYETVKSHEADVAKRLGERVPGGIPRGIPTPTERKPLTAFEGK